MLRASVSVLALVACGSLAAAADLEGSLKDTFSAPAAHSWTGIYVGAHAGYAWGDLGLSSNDGFNPPILVPDGDTVSADGWLGGAQIGAQYQLGAIVVGIEGDVSLANMDGDAFFATQKFIDSEGASGTGWDESLSVDRIATIRGRLGYSLGQILLYGTAGWAWADVDARHVVISDGINPHRISNVDKTLSGYVVGGGLEWALSQNVSIKGEYLYMDFDRETFAHDVQNQNGNPDLLSSDLEVHTVRVGVNLKFGN